MPHRFCWRRRSCTATRNHPFESSATACTVVPSIPSSPAHRLAVRTPFPPRDPVGDASESKVGPACPLPLLEQHAIACCSAAHLHPPPIGEALERRPPRTSIREGWRGRSRHASRSHATHHSVTYLSRVHPDP